MTLAPSSASRRAMAKPIPLVEPVIRAVLFSSCKFIARTNYTGYTFAWRNDSSSTLSGFQ